MIPVNGRAWLDLHLDTARNTQCAESAESALEIAMAILGYAVAVDHLTPAQYSNEVVMINLIRAQRKNAART